MYVYKFVDYKENIIYIGKTSDIFRRMKQHFNGKGHLPKECYKDTFEIYYIELDGKTNMDIYETYLINKYIPKYNKEKQFNEKLDNHNNNEFINIEEIEWKPLYFRFRQKGIEIKKTPFSYEFFNRDYMDREKCEKLLEYNYYLLKYQTAFIKKYAPSLHNNLQNTLMNICKDIKENNNFNIENSCFDEPLDISKNECYEWVAITKNTLNKYNKLYIEQLIKYDLLYKLNDELYGIVALTPYSLSIMEEKYDY